MSVDGALYTILSTELAALMTEPLKQISPKPIDRKVAYPHVWFHLLGDPEGSGRPERWRRLRIHIKDSDFYQCVALVDAVRDALANGFGTIDGFTFDHIQCLDRGADPELNTETEKYETYSDFRVCYH